MEQKHKNEKEKKTAVPVLRKGEEGQKQKSGALLPRGWEKWGQTWCETRHKETNKQNGGKKEKKGTDKQYKENGETIEDEGGGGRNPGGNLVRKQDSWGGSGA